MAEAAWLAAEDVSEMVPLLGASNEATRKCRLFALQCVRSIRGYLRDVRSLKALEFFEANSEELCRRPVERNLRRRCRRAEVAAIAADEAAQAVQRAAGLDDHCHPDVWNRIVLDSNAAAAARYLLQGMYCGMASFCARCTENVVSAAAEEPYRPGAQSLSSWNAYQNQRRLNVAWLRDIFGNPFRPVAFDAAWRTGTAVSLARHMYESRDFSAMPILADALQDAGCEHEAVLAHCRDPHQVHVRGCWVVDLVLGKE
jgi:hypothetical protein